jgi:hypothetical protein
MYNMYMETSIEVVDRTWDPLPDEPEVWYKIFREYYLPLGEQRSIRNAFEFYIRVEKPKQYEHLDPENLTQVPQHWAEYAHQFRWAERAIEYDKEKIPDLGSLYVQQVLGFLSANAMSAAEALVKALNSDRTRVQAANSILNRIGVPEASEVNVRTGITITSDDMAAAKTKAEEWKTKRLSG